MSDQEQGRTGAAGPARRRGIGLFADVLSRRQRDYRDADELANGMRQEQEERAPALEVFEAARRKAKGRGRRVFK